MSDWKADFENALNRFIKVTGLARASICQEDIQVDYLVAPRTPPSRFPKSKMAVYAFWLGGECLRIGLAGPSSNPRYTSQHYNTKSAQNTLAASLLKNTDISESPHFNRKSVGDWIESNCHSINIPLDTSHGMLFLRLQESFLHLHFGPRYAK